MITLLLGGGSLKNRAWVVDEVKPALEPELDCTPLIYDDWLKDQDVSALDFEKELQKALEIVEDQPFNLLCKSAGSVLGMMLLDKVGSNAKKIVICGIPLNDFSADELNVYHVLTSISPERIFCIQNSSDPHGSFKEAKSFLTTINSQITVTERAGDTHNYPYYEDFKTFLLQ